MNVCPSWIRCIPEMIETLALAARERIDRQTVERLFDLRKTAAFQLLRRMGAEPVGHSLAISRTLLMARLREAHEHPHWHWEKEHRIRIRERIDQLRSANRKSIVPLTRDLRERMEARVGLRSLAPGDPSTKPSIMAIFVRATQLLTKERSGLGWSALMWTRGLKLKLNPQEPALARTLMEGFAPHLNEACSGSIS